MAVNVFIGDSVTDCDRIDFPPFGTGYVKEIASSGRLAGQIINVGTSGHRLVDLEQRWERDVLAHRPTLLSIAIGINDTWRRYDDNDPTPVGDFEARYRRVLDSALLASSLKLVLCEPFLLEVDPAMLNWREDLDPKIEVVHRLAQEYSATLIPFDQEFSTLAKSRPMGELAGDGIHPTEAGHRIMAELWLKSLSL